MRSLRAPSTRRSAGRCSATRTRKRGRPACTRRWDATSDGKARRAATFSFIGAHSPPPIPSTEPADMDFVLALHSHLPYVLNHGRWPHGSDWICEAAVDSYLPLVDSLQALAEEEI